MMKFIVRRGVQLLLSVSLLLHAAAVLAQVEIQLRMLPEKGVELEYHVPRNVHNFGLIKTGLWHGKFVKVGSPPITVPVSKVMN